MTIIVSLDVLAVYFLIHTEKNYIELLTITK